MPTDAPSATTPRRRRFGRWRVLTLSLVYVLMVVHIVHWRLNGRTLAPLELNEVMYTLELGIVTAGFIFMAIALLSVLIFGRFFCSWGCHILALQDLSAWWLGKLKFRPKPVRSRLLMLVAPAAAVYMFIWPQISRLIAGQSFPELRVTADESGWASFVTAEFWRNLPGPGIMLLTFLVVGFVIVYILGTRSFCRYICPYGAVFGLADRFAPGKIVARGDCSACGTCTAHCQSNIRVHEELTVFGRVVSPGCLKDLDCVEHCPNGAIAFGFARPSPLTSRKRSRGVKLPRYDFALAEEALMALVFIASLLALRGLYGLIPFLLSLALAAIAAYTCAIGVHLVRRPNVRMIGQQLKRSGRLTQAGRLAMLMFFALGLLLGHCGWMRYHEWAGSRAMHDAASAPPLHAAELSDAAYEHFSIVDRWGLFTTPQLRTNLSHLLTLRAEGLVRRGELSAGVEALRQAIEHDPTAARPRYDLGVLLTQYGMVAEAVEQYRLALRWAPDDVDLLNNLGGLLMRQRAFEDAEHHLRRALRIAPDAANPHFNLGRLLLLTGRSGEGERHVERAAELDASYQDWLDEYRRRRAAEFSTADFSAAAPSP